MQFKQFAISTMFITVAAVGLSVSNSFDQDYMAKVEKQEKALEKLAAAEKANKNKKDTKVGFARN